MVRLIRVWQAFKGLHHLNEFDQGFRGRPDAFKILCCKSGRGSWIDGKKERSLEGRNARKLGTAVYLTACRCRHVLPGGVALMLSIFGA